MTDFQYDSYDISSLKTAFENLNKAETQGFWLGVVGGAPLGYWLITRKSLQNKFKAGPISMTISSLAVGSLLYGAYIFRARQVYNDVAGKINRKYSVLINKAITYN